MLRIEQPAILTDKSSTEDKWDFKEWDRSNSMSPNSIERGIPETFRGAVFEKLLLPSNSLRKLKHFAKNDKAETSTLLVNLVSMRYNRERNKREYIL